MDAQHRHMFKATNLVYEMQRGGSRDEVLQAFAQLIHVTSVHFAHEEELMAQTGYPKTEVHTENHRELLRQLHGFADAYTAGRFGTDHHKALGFLRQWLDRHISSFDRDLADHIKTVSGHDGDGAR